MNKRATPEEFVRTWQNSGSRGEVAKALGMKLQSVSARAALYRKHGVRLKRFENHRGRNKLDIAALNKLCK